MQLPGSNLSSGAITLIMGNDASSHLNSTSQFVSSVRDTIATSINGKLHSTDSAGIQTSDNVVQLSNAEIEGIYILYFVERECHFHFQVHVGSSQAVRASSLALIFAIASLTDCSVAAVPDPFSTSTPLISTSESLRGVVSSVRHLTY